MTSLTPYERETVVTMNDGEDTAHIYTHQSTVLTALRKNPAATLIEEGRWGTTKWGEFEIPVWAISFRTKKRGASEKQREAARNNVANARAARTK